MRHRLFLSPTVAGVLGSTDFAGIMGSVNGSWVGGSCGPGTARHRLLFGVGYEFAD